MNKDEALKMAMRFAEANSTTRISTLGKDDALTGQEVFEACKEALEQPAQEPVAWMPRVGQIEGMHKMTDGIPLYTHPAPLWQGLSDDEIDVIMDGDICQSYYEMLGYARAIEQELRNKNART